MTTSVVAAQRVNPVDADVAQPKSAIAVPASTTVTPLNMGDARATTPPPTPQTAIVQSTIVAPVTAMPVGQPVASKVTTKQAPADAPRATAAAHESLPRTIVATAADALRAVTGPAASGPTAATNQIADNETAQPRADANDKTAATAPQANAPAPATHTALPVGHNAAPHVADTPASAAPAQVQAVTHAAPVAQAAQTAPAQTTSAEQPVRLPEHASSHDAGAAPEIQALAVRIAAKSAQGNKRFDIRLDPPELGRIDVRLDVDANGRATAQLAADKPQTVDLLSRDHRQLERALKDAGLDLGSMSFSLKGDERQQTPRAVARPQTETRTSAPTIASVAPIARWSLVADARVDIRI